MRGRNRWPASELALAVAVVMATIGVFSIQTPQGKWAMAGALVLGLLAAVEITGRERRRRDR
jgi:hypothetical protein